MQPLDYCRQKAAESKSNFLSGFRFLPPAQRDAMTVLYAYCRELDDVVDDCSDPNIAQITLNWWRNDLSKVFGSDIPEHPVNQALKHTAAAFSLPHEELAELIDGMQMDLDQARYQDFDSLKRYCRCVAGVVGCLIARILGFTDPQTLDYADKMGLALQLTNIIRDVGEDARNGRIYLPLEDLQQFGVPAAVIMRAEPNKEFASLMAFQINRTRETYRHAAALLPQADKKAQKAGLVMAAIYYALLNEIERDGAENVLKYKIAIPSPRKKRIALKTWLFGFKP
ncbi:presqualene diphosphate synthase HpnD [Neisseria animalis]|uniref:Squalene synthase HpnD n=1 Tax=Neisseria animalis TaxID=492 RepID=A0A5P3MT72_NEIAN|nr:presqualene diphosphate synthase HpnD [Neisseria animalis]QEY24803.1 squalene synthase HpnD [Neisseria animalis]ROW31527.1 squalene synthase HpnD [Neisseria animalis]VEE07681.1 poly-isoprenyl transferase [Neisseria animalis]